jgi:hypothetical protein
VYLVHRRDTFRASDIMVAARQGPRQDRARPQRHSEGDPRPTTKVPHGVLTSTRKPGADRDLAVRRASSSPSATCPIRPSRRPSRSTKAAISSPAPKLAGTALHVPGRLRRRRLRRPRLSPGHHRRRHGLPRRDRSRALAAPDMSVAA